MVAERGVKRVNCSPIPKGGKGGVVCGSSRSPPGASDGAHLNHEERLKLAMNAMQEGAGMVYTRAVQLYGVKRSTLHDHVSLKCRKFTKGRYPLLTAVEERELLEMLRKLAARGYAITPDVCRRAAFMYARLCEYPASSGAGRRQMAGRKWFAAFSKRNNVALDVNRNLAGTSRPTDPALGARPDSPIR